MVKTRTKKKKAKGGPGEAPDGSTPSDDNGAHAGDGGQPEDSILNAESVGANRTENDDETNLPLVRHRIQRRWRTQEMQ